MVYVIGLSSYGFTMCSCTQSSDGLFMSLFLLQTEDSPHRYRGMVHAVRTIVKEEGARALYKGWLPSVIGVVKFQRLHCFSQRNSF